MGASTKIEWTDATWNPIRARVWEIQDDGGGKERIGWHCEHASEGCRNCYAERINLRLGTGLPFKPGHLYRPEREGYANGEAKLFLDERMLTQPLRWRAPRMIFVGSMTDLSGEFVPDEMIDRVFAVMALCPQHTFQLLTKRPERMRAYFEVRKDGDPWAEAADAVADAIGIEDHPYVLEPRDIPLSNVWLGTSVEDQPRADKRVPELLATPAAVRFISAEPLLGSIDLTNLPISMAAWRYDALSGQNWMISEDSERLTGFPRGKLDWIITGGESGPGARPMHPDWVRSLRDQALAAGVPFHFKQWGAWAPDDGSGGLARLDDFIGKARAGRLLDGRTWDERPAAPPVRGAAA